jgi:hypothetical protein
MGSSWQCAPRRSHSDRIRNGVSASHFGMAELHKVMESAKCFTAIGKNRMANISLMSYKYLRFTIDGRTLCLK